MSSMEPEIKKEPIKILLSQEDAHIFYNKLGYLPTSNTTPKQKEVFNSVLYQLRCQIKE